MEELAENLQKLGEEDLLQVVQMIHDGKSTESYTKNDVDGSMHSPFAPSSLFTPQRQNRSFSQGLYYKTPVPDLSSPSIRKSTDRQRKMPGRLDPHNTNAQAYGFPDGVVANVYPIAGEFHVDLYTLPDDLIQSLWTFTESRV